MLASESASGIDSTVKLWDTITRALLHTLPGRWVALSPDGKQLALASASDPGLIKLWDTATGKLLHTIGCGYVAAFSPDGKQLVSARQSPGDRTIKLWDAATGAHLDTS